MYANAFATVQDAHRAMLWTELVKMAPQLDPQMVKLAFLFVLIGFGTKAGVVPLHFWLPQTYSAAPATVAALMSAKVALYGLIRVGVDVLGASQWWWGLIVLAFGAVSASVRNE